MSPNDIKRLNYYEKQFLRPLDFQDEQSYHIEMRHRHLIAHHSWGIVVGLEITQASNDWSVQPGMAVDGRGREIVVFAAQPLDTDQIKDQFAGSTSTQLKVWLAYKLEKNNRPAPGYEAYDQQDQFTRIRETFRLIYQDKPPTGDQTKPPRPDQGLSDDPDTNPWPVYLGTITWDPDQTIVTNVAVADTRDGTSRQYIGDITAQIVAPAGEIVLRDHAAKSPLDSCIHGVSVRIEGSLQVECRMTARDDMDVLGNLSIGKTLHVLGGGAHLSTGHLVTDASNGALVLDAGPPDATDSAGIWLRKTTVLGDERAYTDLMRITDTGNVGIGTIRPVSRLEIVGDVALQPISSGPARSLSPGTTMIWNDGSWLRLNQNLDYTLPIMGVHTPGLFAPGSLNVGGANSWGDPGFGNAWFSGNVGIGTTTTISRLEVGGDIALESVSPGPARALPAGTTMIWNDSNWLRLNQNLDYTRPIMGVYTPGLFASESLNVGGSRVNNWDDPGTGNAWFSGSIGTSTITVQGNRTYLQGLDASNTHWIMAGGAQENVNNAIGFTILPTLKLFHTGPGWIKGFFIEHPLDVENKYLSHATLEGPEAAVFYRGEAELSNGTAIVALPDYFETLTRKEGRTVQLTPKFEDETSVSMVAASKVEDGHFEVKMATGRNRSQKFYWEVKAVRADVGILSVEQMKAPKG